MSDPELNGRLDSDYTADGRGYTMPYNVVQTEHDHMWITFGSDRGNEYDCWATIYITLKDDGRLVVHVLADDDRKEQIPETTILPIPLPQPEDTK